MGLGAAQLRNPRQARRDAMGRSGGKGVSVSEDAIARKLKAARYLDGRSVAWLRSILVRQEQDKALAKIDLGPVQSTDLEAGQR